MIIRPVTTATSEKAQPTIKCPDCGSAEVEYKSKKAVWECRACEERFPGPPPQDDTRYQRLSDKAKNPKSIFFSYGHDSNKELVERFRADLEKRGHRVWFDAKDIGNWDDWKGAITRGIDRSDMAIAFLSRHALRDPGVCRNEIAISLNRFGVIYPVAVESDIFDDTPVTIRHFQWPDLSQWRAIRQGEIPGQDWERWYESRLIELITKIEGEASQFVDESRVLREVLRPSTFESKFAQHLPGFIGRDWVIDAYRHWLEEQPQSRLFWIKAGPGVGKTALAANLAARERGAIVASWFCDAKSPTLKDPAQMIRSLAYQLSLRWEDYRVRLMRNIGIAAATSNDSLDEIARRLNTQVPQDLFRTLIIEPLINLIWREHKLVIVIDGLDEATEDDGNNPLTEFLAKEMGNLPEWIGLVVTSRPEPGVIASLQGFRPFEFDTEDPRNLDDLRAWYQAHLVKQEQLGGLEPDEQRRLEELLIERSEGMVLYLKLVEEGLNEQSFKPADLERLTPGLAGLYANYSISFQHRFGNVYESDIRLLMRLLVAAAGPLPEDLACEILGWNSEQFSKTRIRLGSYIVESPAGLELFHKTLKDWLGQKENNLFYVDPELGRQQIADSLFKEVAAVDSFSVRWREPIRLWLGIWWNDLTQKTDFMALTTLGTKLKDWGDSSAAEKLFRKVLEISKTTLSTDPGVIAGAQNNLGSILSDTGRDGEAEIFFRQALDILKSGVRVDGLSLAACLNNLAGMFRKRGRYDQAEPLYIEALAIQKEVLPAGDPEIAPILNNLAVLLHTTGRSDQAESLLRESLEIRRATLPAGHPHIARGLSLLADLLKKTSRYGEAEKMYREALQTLRNSLPSDHPEVLTCAIELSNVLVNTDQYKEAESVLQEALSIRKAELSAGRSEIISSLADLAQLLQAKGRASDAEAIYREALDMAKVDASCVYPKLGVLLNNLALLLMNTGRNSEAEPMFREALATAKRLLPTNHSEIAKNLGNLAASLMYSGKTREAEALFREALETQKNVLPASPLDIASLKSSLGYLLKTIGKFDEAERLYREALSIRKASLPVTHPTIADSLNNLALLLNGLGRNEEVIPLLREKLDIDFANLPPGHLDLVQGLNTLNKLINAVARLKEPKAIKITVGSDVTVREKVGRNEACSCGSGKKYKRCCGRS